MSFWHLIQTGIDTLRFIIIYVVNCGLRGHTFRIQFWRAFRASRSTTELLSNISLRLVIVQCGRNIAHFLELHGTQNTLSFSPWPPSPPPTWYDTPRPCSLTPFHPHHPTPTPPQKYGRLLITKNIHRSRWTDYITLGLPVLFLFPETDVFKWLTQPSLSSIMVFIRSQLASIPHSFQKDTPLSQSLQKQPAQITVPLPFSSQFQRIPTRPSHAQLHFVVIGRIFSQTVPITPPPPVSRPLVQWFSQ